MWGSQEKILGHKVNEKIFRVDPGRKNSKKWIKYYSHSRSRSRSFPRMEASDSLSRTLGMDFFIPFPFSNFGNGLFSFPSRSRILGMDFFHSLPVPEFWEGAFSIPFPFPNFGNGIFYSRSRSRTLKSHSRSPLAGGCKPMLPQRPLFPPILTFESLLQVDIFLVIWCFGLIF